jgi:hypothetical protein
MEGQVATVDPSLQQFRSLVTAWLELDNLIRKLQATLKDKRELKGKVTSRILDFMTRNNVEDVNTQQIKLRYKVVKAKSTLTQKQIKERLLERLPDAKEEVDAAFGDRAVVERATLRRLKVSNGLRSVSV